MKWREVNDNGYQYWQYMGPMGVYGTVSFEADKRYYWCARVMENCRIDGEPPRGKALALDGAKRVVELLCEITGTAGSL